MPTFARGLAFDVRVIKPPAVGGLLNLVTYELFRFEDLRPGKHGRHLLRIGASDTCDIVLADPSVSAVHALVECGKHGTYRLLDAMSRNGVFRVMRRHAERIGYLDLAVGHRIIVGATTLLCVTEDGHAPLTDFDVSEFLFTADDRNDPVPVPGSRSQRKTLRVLWQAIRRGKRT